MTIAPGFVWPDQAGTATDPTTAFVASSRVLSPDEQERELHCRLSLAGTQPRAIQLQLAVSYWGQSNYVTVERRTILCAAGTTAYEATLRGLPPYCEAVVSARRYGGDATTTLTVSGYARAVLGERTIDGQPLELAAHQAAGVECWGSGAGAHAHPVAGPNAHAESPAVGPLWIPTGEADTLVIDYTVGATAADAIEFEIRESTDEATTTNLAVTVAAASGGASTQLVERHVVSGAVGEHQTKRIRVRPGTSILVLAQRNGGAAGTELFALARLYKLGAAAGDGGAAASAGALLSGPTLCFSEVAPGLGHKALTVNFDDSDEPTNRWIAIPSGTRTIRCTFTTSGTAPTALEVMPYWSPDGGATAIALESTDSVAASEQRVTPLYLGFRGQAGAATLAAGTYLWTLSRGPDGQVPSRATSIELQARRSGGAADTELLAYVEFEG